MSEYEEVTATVPTFEVLYMRYFVPGRSDHDSLEECYQAMVYMVDWNTAAPVCTLVDGEPAHEFDYDDGLKPISAEMLEEANKLLERVRS